VQVKFHYLKCITQLAIFFTLLRSEVVTGSIQECILYECIFLYVLMAKEISIIKDTHKTQVYNRQQSCGCLQLAVKSLPRKYLLCIMYMFIKDVTIIQIFVCNSTLPKANLQLVSSLAKEPCNSKLIITGQSTFSQCRIVEWLKISCRGTTCGMLCETLRLTKNDIFPTSFDDNTAEKNLTMKDCAYVYNNLHEISHLLNILCTFSNSSELAAKYKFNSRCLSIFYALSQSFGSEIVNTKGFMRLQIKSYDLRHG